MAQAITAEPYVYKVTDTQHMTMDEGVSSSNISSIELMDGSVSCMTFAI